MPKQSKLIFLPGALGIPAFWNSLSAQLKIDAQHSFMAYPGFGNEPLNPAVTGIDDLVQSVVQQIDQPTALIAQSMGGILAVRAALAKPELVTHLVLSVTSGGVDMAAFAAYDWRPDFLAAHPHLPDWFITHCSDLTQELKQLTQPVLLLWGDADPISPVAVGEHLRALLPNAKLHVVPGGGHDIAHAHAAELAPLVDQHLQQES